ncbi:MAG: MarR family transcriptional regulator [Syntrophales bacterium]|nr:MarR family transcriptional regulator [Syntrophales bacterium]MDD4338791.1 MarR family transcriptional regulator [Syntrophales bacterium]HOG07348.1 MarR family transcriptional regulator [Syntrophales bacterium]HOS76706.1 MarR family transcriptional regulator [Syntrophales bacterium]HPB70104.1 MarR family transcriptional regulator [Syntrophales bacterium]
MKPEDCIFFQLAKAHQLGSRFLAQKVAALNITPVQALVLGFLADEDGITSSELGKRTELDSATMTGLLDRLEAARLLERRVHPADRRSIQIHLTDPGRTLAAEAVRSIVEANREFLDILTERERKELRGLIRKLRDQSGRA